MKVSSSQFRILSFLVFYSILVHFCLAISFSIFFEYLKQDNVVANYYSYTDTIYNNIINTTNQDTPLQFRDVGLFPIMVDVRGGDIDLIHYTIPEKKNIITNVSENYKAIIGLTSKGSPTEIKQFDKDSLHNGKTLKTNRLLEINNIGNIKTHCTLSNQAATYRSYIFCPLDFLSILNDLDSLSWTAEIILFKFVVSIKSIDKTDAEKTAIFNSYSPILAWYFNALHDKIESFPFYYKTSPTTIDWHNLICNTILGSPIDTYSMK